MIKTLLAACTPRQAKILANNPHLIPIDMLHDGDILVLDTADFRRFELNAESEIYPLGPYILNVNGSLQSVTFHYLNSHPWDIDQFENPGQPTD